MQMATSWPRNAVTRQTLYELHSLYMMNLANQAGWTEVGATPRMMANIPRIKVITNAMNSSPYS